MSQPHLNPCPTAPLKKSVKYWYILVHSNFILLIIFICSKRISFPNNLRSHLRLFISCRVVKVSARPILGPVRAPEAFCQSVPPGKQAPGPTVAVCDLGMLVSCCCLVAKSCPTLCDPMACSTPASSVLHYVLEFTQTHVHRLGDAIQPSHPLLSPSPPAALNLSQHQGLFQ